MCDPTVLAIAGTVAGVAGQAVNYFGQMSAQDQQKKEYDAWAAQQSKNRQLENARQDQERGKAIQAQQEGLQGISADAQKKAQEDEQARLTDYLQGNQQDSSTAPIVPHSVADRSLTGQQSGGDQYQTDLASKLNQATSDSKARLAALARVQSYGGSQGGLDQTVSGALQKSGSAIDLANSFRKGSLGAFQVEQAVNPKQITYTPSPIGGIASSLFSMGTQGLGSTFANAFTPAAAAAPTTVKYGNVNYKMF